MPIRLVTSTTNKGKLYTQAELDQAVKEERGRLKNVIAEYKGDLNWFTVHIMSAYKKADQKTKDHIDKLYLELIKRNKKTSKVIHNKKGE